MTVEPDAFFLGPGEGEARWGLEGSLTSVKATGALAGGRLAVIEDVARRGDSTPLHRHSRDDESFYVLEGTVSFWLGDDGPIRAEAGAFVYVPGGVAHAFRVDSETARYLIVTTAQHGEFYRAISDPAPEHTLPPPTEIDMGRVEAACERFEVEILGPPPSDS